MFGSKMLFRLLLYSFLFEGIIGLVNYKSRVTNKKPFLYDFRNDEYSDNDLSQEKYEYYLKLLVEKFPKLMDILDNFEGLCVQKLKQVREEMDKDSFA
jgi:hypothetical protein